MTTQQQHMQVRSSTAMLSDMQTIFVPNIQSAVFRSNQLHPRITSKSPRGKHGEVTLLQRLVVTGTNKNTADRMFGTEIVRILVEHGWAWPKLACNMSVLLAAPGHSKASQVGFLSRGFKKHHSFTAGLYQLGPTVNTPFQQ